MITITSRYVLFNNSSEPLQYGQRNTNLVWQLAPGVKAPFHWDDADGRFELCVRPAQGKWNWSGAFEVGPAFLTPLACVSHTPVFVMCQVACGQKAGISASYHTPLLQIILMAVSVA